MIRHIVLFRFKPGITHSDPRVADAIAVARDVGTHVPCLRQWYTGSNISTRPVAYDFVVIGLVDDEAALEEYMTAPFHVHAIDLWREISDWVMVDVVEEAELQLGSPATGNGMAL